MLYAFLLFLLLNNILINELPVPEVFNYWDELFFFFIILYWLFFKKGKNNEHKITKNNFINYSILIIIMIIGIFGNFIYNYAYSYNAIIRDIVNFLKFPLSILILIDIENNRNITEKYKISLKDKNSSFEKIIKALIIVIFICGIISLFADIGMSQLEIRNGIKPYQFLYSHPTVLVLNSVFLLAILETISSKKNILLYRFLILIIMILTMRTKGIVFVSLYIFIVYFGKKLKKLKLIYIILAVIVIIGASYSKLQLYSSFSSSPREVLYMGSFKLLYHCFPLGSGFGTFASHISATYFSNAYSFINLPRFYLDTPNYLVVLGDAGYPYYIAQFGLIGFLLFIKLLYNIYIMLTKSIREKKGIVIIMIYFLIALTSESTLINFGIELAFMLMFIYRNNYIDGGESE